MIKNNPEDAGITSGKNISYWTDTVTPEAQNPLKENLETDVVIVGGGLAGLSVAYCLTQSGKKIIYWFIEECESVFFRFQHSKKSSR